MRFVKYLRASDEAVCTRTSDDPDPRNKSVSMLRVFKTFCTMAADRWNPIPISKVRKKWSYLIFWSHYLNFIQCCTFQASLCLANGHEENVKIVKEKYGKDVPQNIGVCLLY